MNLADKRESLQRNIFAQVCFALFCALFGAIYEYFSHEVYSYYMLYAFAIPLVLVVLPLLLVTLRAKRFPDHTARRLWNYGTITLTVGCLFRGVLDIFGTTNRLLWVYPVVSGIFFGTAVLMQIRAGRS